MAVSSSNDSYSTHFLWQNSWNTNYFLRRNIHEVWLSNEFIIGLLEMWLNLLDQKYTHNNCNIWSNVSRTFSPHLAAFDRHPKYRCGNVSIIRCIAMQQWKFCSDVDVGFLAWTCLFSTVHPTRPKICKICWWLYFFLKNLEIILLLYYSIYFH